MAMMERLAPDVLWERSSEWCQQLREAASCGLTSVWGPAIGGQSVRSQLLKHQSSAIQLPGVIGSVVK
ncbi:hypothetical protein [Streptomyces collinus]|uniref:hypothetical protein n=1 Tax=Streptomyces collinus TaxID=42684 RepID=UPI0037D1C792